MTKVIVPHGSYSREAANLLAKSEKGSTAIGRLFSKAKRQKYHAQQALARGLIKSELERNLDLREKVIKSKLKDSSWLKRLMFDTQVRQENVRKSQTSKLTN